MNDLAAVGALAGALEAGVTVPAELAVTGYDDTFFSAIPQVSLTTVNPDNATIGTTAAQRLLHRVGQPGAEGGNELIPPRLVVRATTSSHHGREQMPDQDLLATCWTTAGDAAPLRGDERSRSPCGNGSSPRPRPGSVGSGCSMSTWSWPNGSMAWPGSGRCSTTTVSSTWSWSSSPTGGPTGHDGGGPTRSAGGSWRPPGALGARHVKVAPDVSGEPWDHDRWGAEFAVLAEDARQAGTRVGLEFLPLVEHPDGP